MGKNHCYSLTPLSLTTAGTQHCCYSPLLPLTTDRQCAQDYCTCVAEPESVLEILESTGAGVHVYAMDDRLARLANHHHYIGNVDCCCLHCFGAPDCCCLHFIGAADCCLLALHRYCSLPLLVLLLLTAAACCSLPTETLHLTLLCCRCSMLMSQLTAHSSPLTPHCSIFTLVAAHH